MNDFFSILKTNPIIANINDLTNLERALDSKANIIFLSTGTIFNLKEISKKIFDKNKLLYINVDVIEGFSKDLLGLEYIIKNIRLSGIISSKENIIKKSMEFQIFTIFKVYISDYQSLDSYLQLIKKNRPHCIEVYPGNLPKILNSLSILNMPIISSGLIDNYNEVDQCIKSGAIGISSENKNLWDLRSFS